MVEGMVRRPAVVRRMARLRMAWNNPNFSL